MLAPQSLSGMRLPEGLPCYRHDALKGNAPLTQTPGRHSRPDPFLRPGIWALICVRKCVPQQLGDTLSHTNQCPDSGRQKRAMAENTLATRTFPIVKVIFLERICGLLQPPPREPTARHWTHHSGHAGGVCRSPRNHETRSTGFI